ncbi:MAG TPA: hypothetical protein VMQ65_02035, partial [Candidatus Limnocylindria bacterium]|nr:hypothetical protein [Candidatus Limnocylindria bacterium]
TTAANLQSVDTDGTLVFGANAPGVAGAKPGNVLVLEGVGPRKVVSVATEGSTLVVVTEDATIAEVIRDGKLGWTYRIAYDALPDKAYVTAMAEAGLTPQLASTSDQDAATLRELAVSRQQMRFVGKVSGFEVEFKLTPTAEKLSFELSASRNNVKVQAAGFISQFVQETRMEFDDGAGTLFDTNVTGLKGEAEVTWNAFQVNDPSLDQDIVALQLPLSLPIPFMAGPIPMTINIKTNIRVVPELTGGQASSGGAWKVTYDSDQGFSTNGGDPTPKSQLRNMIANLGSEPTVTAGLGVVGFGLGFEFPRLELALGHPVNEELLKQATAGAELLEKISSMLRPYVFLTLNTYVSGLWTPGTTLSGEIPPCQRSSVKVSSIAGYKLSVLGMVELSDNKLIWEKAFDRFKDDKPCTLTGT